MSSRQASQNGRCMPKETDTRTQISYAAVTAVTASCSYAVHMQLGSADLGQFIAAVGRRFSKVMDFLQAESLCA